MKLRLLILVGPITLVVIVLLILAAYRPGATGRLEIKDCAKLDVQTNGEPLHVDGDSVELITELVMRNMPVAIEAGKIAVSGKRDTFQHLLLQPLGEFEFIHDLPSADQRRISFGVESPQNVKLLLAHRSDNQGAFYCDISANGQAAFSISYDRGTPDITLIVKGARILNAAENDMEVARVTNDSLELTLSTPPASAQGPAIRFASTPKGASNFLSIRYKLPSGLNSIPIFSRGESSRLQLEGRNYLSSIGTARLLLAGKVVDELGGVDVAVEGAALKMPRGITGSANGFSTELEGKFDFVGSAAVGTSLEAAANPARPPKFSSRLPSKLSQIESFYLILLGAIAYVIDKVITLVKFLKPSAD